MKKTTLTACAALGGAMLLTGCIFRFTEIEEIYPPRDGQVAVAKTNAPDKKAMTVAEASAIVKDMLDNPPAGRRPDHPGDRALGKFTTSIRLREHIRTGLVLVEVMEARRSKLEFYVRTQADGEKFAAAVWRLRREYADK